ncbi:transposase [Rhodobacter sp. M37P]|uniref:Transposase n=1 Tax=Rhodobacter calidifons TaxID=2715277 RepID=A0ABX0G8B3_9RHOB|nr:transposase [Rhodobacter calidifons]
MRLLREVCSVATALAPHRTRPPRPGSAGPCSGQQLRGECATGSSTAPKADHLPLYRQSQIFDREGLDLDRSTLADWVGKSTALLEPLADAIGRHVLSAEAIFADDTPISMLAPGTGKTQTARLWTYARNERPWGSDAPPAAWYRFSGDRKGQHPKDHLARYRGWMMLTDMPGSKTSTAPGPSARSPAWPMSGASSSTSTGRKARPSPKRQSAGSPSFTLWRRRPEGRHLIDAPNSATPMPPRSSTIWSDRW